MFSPSPPRSNKPYPEHWDRVAEIRVFRALATEWQKLITWRTDLGKRGYRLLRVVSEGDDMVAVFGRSRDRGRELTDTDLKSP